jgi:apolipoprotein N-acyltransferase
VRPTGASRERPAGLSNRWALLVALAGGLTLAAAFPPVGAWPLAAAGPALLTIALWRSSTGFSLVIGLVFGAAFFVPLLTWLVNVAWYVWAALAVTETVVFAATALGQRLLLRLRAWPAAVAGWWVAAEAVRDRWPWGGFPWGRLAMSQAGAPTAGWVAVGGPPLLTFLLALAGACLAWVLLVPSRQWRRRLLGSLAFAAAAGIALAGGLLPVDGQAAGISATGTAATGTAATGTAATGTAAAGQATGTSAGGIGAPGQATGPGMAGTGAAGTGAASTGAASTGAASTGAASTGAAGTEAAGTEAAGTEAASTGAAAAPTAIVAAVQGNVPRSRTLSQQLRATTVTSNHAVATEQLARQVGSGQRPAPDLVIWPENSTDIDPSTSPPTRQAIQAAVDAIGRPVLVGAVLDHPVRNSGQLWLPGRGPVQAYIKRQLVPFGEVIPFRGVLSKFISLIKLQPVDFTPGHRAVVFRIGKIRLGDVICYEVGFDNLVSSEVAAGANLLTVQTNDADFELDGQTGETLQQLAMARIRAIEHDRAVVVVSTTGVSAIIAPDGSIIASSPTWRRAILEARVPLRTDVTLADRAGNWPEGLVSGAVLAALAWTLAGVPRRRGGVADAQ